MTAAFRTSLLRIFAALAVASCFVLAGCTAKATRQQLLKRAAFDLNCAQGRLKVVQLDARTAGVRGCDQQATYVESCETGSGQHGSYRHNCTWVMNTDGRRTE